LALFPDLTVAENIALRLDTPRAFDRVPATGPTRARPATAPRVGATVSPDSEVRGLSLPAQQLVEIASALGAGARIIIMDEPTASLTGPEVEILFNLVRGLRADGAGIIYISHRLEEIFQLADRVTVLRDGESVGTRVLLPAKPEETESTGNSRALRAEPQESRCEEADAVRRTEANVTAAELIRLMVGREVSQIYPLVAGPTGGSVLRSKR